MVTQVEVGVASTPSPDIQSYVPMAGNYHHCDEGEILDINITRARAFYCADYRGRLVVIKVNGPKATEYEHRFKLCDVEVHGMCAYI